MVHHRTNLVTFNRSFRDFLPIFRNPAAVNDLIDILAEHVRASNPDANTIVGLESRGFLIGPLLAAKLQLPFVPIRKAGKLPGEVEKLAYELEYGNDTFELQKEAISATTSKCVLIDDLLATGGSLQTAIKLIDRCGATVVKSIVIIELAALGGRQRLNKAPVFALITY